MFPSFSKSKTTFSSLQWDTLYFLMEMSGIFKKYFSTHQKVLFQSDIHPPPTSAERRQGYCLRPFRDTGQQRYICTVCGKHYTTMYNMRQHRNIHTGSGLHSCRYCGRSFTHKHVWEVRPFSRSREAVLPTLAAFQIDWKVFQVDWLFSKWLTSQLRGACCVERSLKK